MDYLDLLTMLENTVDSLTERQKKILIKRMLLAKAKRDLSNIDKGLEQEYRMEDNIQTVQRKYKS